MKEHIPNTLPKMTIDIPASEMYGEESTYIQTERPATKAMARRAFDICQLAVIRNSQRIENPYPAHLGGLDQLLVLKALAKKHGVELQFPATDENRV